MQPRPLHAPLLHVRFVKPKPEGGEEVLTESKPSSGGNHVSRIFSELDELLGLGFEADDFAGVFVETYTNGKLEMRSPLRHADIQLILERRVRTMNSTGLS